MKTRWPPPFGPRAGDIRLDHCHLRGHHLDRCGSETLEIFVASRAFGRRPAPRRWVFELDRQGGFPGTATARRPRRYSARLSPPSAVWVSIQGRTPDGPRMTAMRFWWVLEPTRSLIGRTSRKGVSAGQVKETRVSNSRHTVREPPPDPADHVKMTRSEIGRLWDVHRGAAGVRHLVGLGAPGDAGTEELVEDVVFVVARISRRIGRPIRLAM